MFGVNDGDKTYLNRQGIDAALVKLKQIAGQMQKMKSRGGLALVELGELEITTYALDSYNRA
ncbi:MAG: hypothetical protein ACRCZA_15410 [Shewanella sp.]|uniref:hypothetical protein n=1 Tax=Shewanella sp. TaxID=50422 RepID=UPI003F2DB477